MFNGNLHLDYLEPPSLTEANEKMACVDVFHFAPAAVLLAGV